MPLASHVSRRLPLHSTQYSALICHPRLSRTPLCTWRRTLTCLPECRLTALPVVSSSLAVRGAARLTPCLSRAPSTSEESPCPLVEASLEAAALSSLSHSNALSTSVLSSTPVTYAAGAARAAVIQRQLYELVKQTRTAYETDGDRRRTKALAERLFTTILSETHWQPDCSAVGRILTDDTLMDAFTPLLRTAGPATVPRLVEVLWQSHALLLRMDRPSNTRAFPPSIIEAFFSPSPVCALHEQPCRWHPAVSLRLVKVCLQSIAHAVRAKRSAQQALSLATLRDLHETVLRAVPFPFASANQADNEIRANAGLCEELAVLAMTALKGAPCTLLCQLYAYLDEAGLSTVAVMNKFLASCGWSVSNVSSRGQHPLSPAETALILGAVRGLVAASHGDLETTQEGLIYGVPVLLDAGRHAEVVALYGRLPALRETPQSVMARVHFDDVRGAVDAVARLGQSRPEGWVALSPMVLQTLAAVARLLGRRGATQEEVALFYSAVVNFHNASMIVGQLVEDLVAGLCERIETLPQRLGSLRAVSPRQALEQVLPTLRAVLGYVGDELNADTLFGLLESALQVEGMAVPLTTAIVWCLASSEALSVRSLFQRVDASTAGMPFLQYYALCYARDLGDRATHDHLAAVWHANGSAVWLREGQLATPYKLWKCASCGRLNSDRFNYCLCSSLRYGFVLCARCGHGQDERVFLCGGCGSSLREGNTYTAVSRAAWRCGACEATNHARQTLTCLRCRKLTGPVAVALAQHHDHHDHHHHRARGPSETPASAATAAAPPERVDDAFCTCSGPDAEAAAAYARATGCCTACGHFASAHAAAHSKVWRCPGCQQRRSALERTCPHCPQVDCLPALMLGTASALAAVPRQCSACGVEVANLFATDCPACGASEDALVQGPAAHHVDTEGPQDPMVRADSTAAPPPAVVAAASGAQLLLVCAQCLHLTPAATVEATPTAPAPHCRACGTLLARGEAQTLTSCVRHCPQCRHTLPATCTSAVCPRCAAFVPPQTSPVWPSSALVDTVSTLVALATSTSRVPASGVASGSADPLFAETCAETVEASLQRHRVLEETLLQLHRAWCAPASADAVSAASLVPVRVDVVTRLGRFVAALSPFVRTDSHARRAVALAKQLLEALDRHCGVLATHFDPGETCHECLGHHPPELCPYEPLHAPSHACWHCEGCGLENTNADVGRYLCQHCLLLRPAVQSLFVSECWQCARCARANVEFETYCIHCGQSRPATAVSATTLDAASEAGAAQRNHIPFLPARCGDCGLVYLEMRCPLCYPRHTQTSSEDDVAWTAATTPRTDPDKPHLSEASGVVCLVRPHYAFIQPFGTTRPEQRVHIGTKMLGETPLTVGRPVRFVAEREATSGRLRAVALRPQKNSTH